ncbi:hypothetical protein DFH11DRAFT_1590642 [Phellopilus nigrolimitatus]|nr:hypothetical protein DFH11DRAFT_1590642 [Phellopilus nigrolimitatus]
MSSIITIPQPPSNPRDRASRDLQMGVTCASDPDTSPEDADADVDDLKIELASLNCKEGESSSSDTEQKHTARRESLERLQGRGKSRASLDRNVPVKPRTRKPSGAEAKIVLKEERANTFHDFLKFVYPQ